MIKDRGQEIVTGREKGLQESTTVKKQLLLLWKNELHLGNKE